MDPELREHLDAIRNELAGLRTELRTEIRSVDESIRTEIRTTEARLRKVIRRGDRTSRRHFGVLAESLHGEIRQVAEIVALNTEAIAQVRIDLTHDMDERFGVVHRAFADVRQDIAALRARH